MKHLTYQVKIAAIVFSLLLFKLIICNNNGGKIKNEENEYEDIDEINHQSDEDLNQEEYDDLRADVDEKENQSLEQVDDQFPNSNQTDLTNLRQMYIKLKKTNLNLYRKLSVNDMFININEDENENEPTNENLIIKAYYKDDIQYDCELPEEYNLIETFDWSINGYMTGMNESSYNIILDKKIDSKNAFLNVTCMFKLLNQTDFFYINFPIVHLGNYLTSSCMYIYLYLFIFFIKIIITFNFIFHVANILILNIKTK
jgi:hypothetical protein